MGLALFLAASLAFVVMDNPLPMLFDFLFVLAGLLNAGNWVLGLFYQPGLYDEIVPAFTTFAVTLALSFLADSSMLTIFRNHKLLYLLTITCFGIAIGALWEVAEWTAGIVLSTEVIESLNDTIIDFYGLFGSCNSCPNGLMDVARMDAQRVRQLGIKHLSPMVRAIALN
ncbi:hypothetical protein QUB63_12365 [Microcoleus sp. ARI1-B5]|uniref:hypothetical protein n=1 Tax=unclassified Microcoleus TaxID=2642155 RepID=UPI002FCF8015